MDALPTLDLISSLSRRCVTNFGFAFEKTPAKTPGSYTMDHSAAMMLVNPQMELVGYIVPPFTADALARDLKSIINR